ncbi:hypothetical protein [Streptomyces sp. URMC 124]|uniref:hypothetical protein n=1 Tax=Streptomyces sp. URMC 124 TaxID=3423405 RepID=UPI003F1C95CC
MPSYAPPVSRPATSVSRPAPPPRRKGIARTALFAALGALVLTSVAVAGYVLTNGASDTGGGTASAGATSTPQAGQRTVTLASGQYLELNDVALTPREGPEDDLYFACVEFEGCKLGANHAQLAQLDAGERGSHAACRKRNVFTTILNTDTLMAGSQLCVRNQEGFAALITIKNLSVSDHRDASVVLIMDVWRDSA